MKLELEKSPLGKVSKESLYYDPALLYRIERKKRLELPYAVDYWTAYELSWLNKKSKPQVALLSFAIPGDSSYIIESKSLKLYLNSFNQSNFSGKEELKSLIEEDLSRRVGKKIDVNFHELDSKAFTELNPFPGRCIDGLDVSCTDFEVNPSLLFTDDLNVQEALHSNLFRSNCPVTNQPDWASIYIHYFGPAIHHAALLKYLCSYRLHQAFHEDCAEQIFQDIKERCLCEKLSVSMRFTRRGGIDINPFRSDFEEAKSFSRLIRQ